MFKDILGDAFPIIQKFAPLIAGAIGSPTASFATSAALNILSHAFNLPSSDMQNIKQSILCDPNSKDKLCKIEENFSDWFKNNNLSADVDIKVHWDNKDEDEDDK